MNLLPCGLIIINGFCDLQFAEEIKNKEEEGKKEAEEPVAPVAEESKA